jgi:hypothetical protein
MADLAQYIERLPLYYEQAQAEYKSTTDRPLRPSAHRSGLARVHDRLYFVLAHSAGILAAFRIQEDGSLKRVERHPGGKLRKALLLHVAPRRRPDHVPGRPE